MARHMPVSPCGLASSKIGPRGAVFAPMGVSHPSTAIRSRLQEKRRPVIVADVIVLVPCYVVLLTFILAAVVLGATLHCDQWQWTSFSLGLHVTQASPGRLQREIDGRNIVRSTTAASAVLGLEFLGMKRCVWWVPLEGDLFW